FEELFLILARQVLEVLFRVVLAEVLHRVRHWQALPLVPGDQLPQQRAGVLAALLVMIASPVHAGVAWLAEISVRGAVRCVSPLSSVSVRCCRPASSSRRCSRSTG